MFVCIFVLFCFRQGFKFHVLGDLDLGISQLEHWYSAGTCRKSLCPLSAVLLDLSLILISM